MHNASYWPSSSNAVKARAWRAYYRAKELNELRGDIAANMGTTAVVRVRNKVTGEARTLISINGADAKPSAWNGKLRKGEFFVRGEGHA